MPAHDDPVLPGSSRRAPAWLVAKGEMGSAIAAYPWKNTPLGELEAWTPNLRLAVNLILDAAAPMALVWGKEFRFLYNDKYAEIIQDKHPSALGALSSEIFPEIWESLRPLFERALSGEAIVVEDYEFRVTRRGVTSPGFFSFNYSPIRNDAGHVDGFLAVVVETTARVIRGQERAQMFDTVLSAITDFAYTFDRDCRFVYVNKALLDLWGLKLEDAVGKNFYELKYPDELAAQLERQIRQVIAEKTTVRDETPYQSPTGAVGYYEYIFSPVFGPDGSVVIVAGSTRDITDRKKLEMEVLAASQAKDDFIAMLSRELRTPLNPVLLLASEGSENMGLPEEVRADFKFIAENVALEARLIDDLLDISRVTHNKFTLDITSQDVHPLLQKVLDSLHAEAKGKELAVIKRFDAQRSVVAGDEVRLRQIFWNLIRNAIKFTPEGGKISVITRAHSTKASTLVIEITDTGIGLSASELARVFSPFAQGEHSIDGGNRFGGLGLGLAISRNIAELHSGSLSAQSPGRNKGATFTLELPIDPFEKPAQDPGQPVAKADPERTQKPFRKVLLVEDHESSRQTLARLLTNRKMDVIQAGSGAEALEKARIHRFDLVISDIGLPDINGYDLMAELKATYNSQGIALSGYGTKRDIARSKEAGFMTHLTKPISVAALDEALKLFPGG